MKEDLLYEIREKRLFLKPVAGPRNSDEMDRLGRRVFDLLPQVMDKGIHGPRRGEFVIAPDFIEDQIPAYDFPFMRDQKLEKTEFLGCQI